jgi:Ca-activated chloride channel family protein
MGFATPAVLALSVLVLPLGWLLFRARRRPFVLSSASVLAAAAPSARLRLARLLPATLVVAVLLLVVALAGPRIGDANAVVPAQGIDIALSVDISSSMTTSQFGPTKGTTRLDATKTVIRDFIKGRKDDRIGVVVFQQDALALSPLSLDYKALDQLVARLDSGLLPDGTGIGVGLAEALNMLKNSSAASRIVILLTDGQHNATSISPRDAAQLAATLKIRVYTIGLIDNSPGGRGEIDEQLLTDMANSTGGRYYAADNPATLKSIYEEIGKLETSKVERAHYEQFTELAPWAAAGAAALLAADLLLGATWLRRVPA